MRNIFALSFFSIILGIAIISCSSKPKRTRKPVTKLTLSIKGDKVITGQSFDVSYKTDPKNDVIDSIFIYLDNQVLLSGKELSGSYTIHTKDLGLGKHSIKAIARNQSGKEGVNYKSIQILSDIAPELYTYKVINEYPHSTDHFTQGLLIHNGYLYEGTGENAHSGIYKKEIKTGKILKEKKLNKKYFGEGVTILNDKIYQVTYHAQKGFVYDLESFARIDSFTYKMKEGWGLANNGKEIIMSDGSESIYFINPETMQVLHSIQVYNHKGPVNNLNELEYINGALYANVWLSDRIVKIDPKTGKVLADINMNDILSVMHKNNGKRIDVLNGIAYDQVKDKIYVTGKLWPRLFEIELVKK